MRILLAIAVLLLIGSSAHADPKPKVAVLEIVPNNSTKGHHAALGFASEVLTAALRSNVAGDPAFEYRDIPKSIDQRSAARTCAALPKCVATLITDSGADLMIYGLVERSSDAINIMVKIQRGEKVMNVKARAMHITTGAEMIRLLAREMYLELTGRPVPQTR